MLHLPSQSGDRTDWQHFFLQHDDCKMADVDVNVVCAVVVFLWEDDKEQKGHGG